MKKTAGKNNSASSKKKTLPNKVAQEPSSAPVMVADKESGGPVVAASGFGGTLGTGRMDVLESISQFSEDYLAGLLEDDLILDARVRQEMPSRLEALQHQLDRLELESFGHLRETAAAGSEAAQNTAKAAEISLSTLKRRLHEMHQKLQLKQPSTVPVKTVPSRVPTGDFPSGEAFDEEPEDLDEDGFIRDDGLLSDDYYGFDTDDYLEELEAAGVLRAGGLDMKQVLAAAQKDVALGAGPAAEGELQAILGLFAAPGLTLEEKLSAVQPKLRALLQQDLYWRTQADRAGRQLHDLRMQKRLADMELERVRSINGRLEGFCKDLQSENRKIKLESTKVEEAMRTALELAAESSGPVTGAPGSAPVSKKEKKRAAAAAASKRETGATTSSVQQSTTQMPTATNVASQSSNKILLLESFPLPELPEREVLEAEPSGKLVDRLFVLADLYEAREAHVLPICDGYKLELRLQEAKLIQNQLILERTIAKLEENEARTAQLTRSEAELKAQVRQYVDKFRQVEETLVKSNELFGTFRGEMEQMSVKLARFERENHQMQSKCQTLSRNIIEMADERTKLTANIETLKSQKTKLEQLCRTLQAERAAARKEDPAAALQAEADQASAASPTAPAEPPSEPVRQTEN